MKRKTLSAEQAIAIANRLIVQMAEMVGTIGELAIANDQLTKEKRNLQDVIEIGGHSDLLVRFTALEQRLAERKARG